MGRWPSSPISGHIKEARRVRSEFRRRAACVKFSKIDHGVGYQTWPEPLRRSLAGVNDVPYQALQGPNEFCFTGSIKSWDRIADLPRLSQLALVMCGLHDELTPACSMRMHHA